MVFIQSIFPQESNSKVNLNVLGLGHPLCDSGSYHSNETSASVTIGDKGMQVYLVRLLTQTTVYVITL